MVETAASTSIDIAASPEAVYGILTDLSRVSEFSPECYRSEWGGRLDWPRGWCEVPWDTTRNGDMKWDAGLCRRCR